MTRLHRIGILFTAKLAAVSMGALGLLAGIAYSFSGFFVELFAGSLNTGTALAFLAIPGMPLLFAACGFCAGAVMAVCYNLCARFGITVNDDSND